MSIQKILSENHSSRDELKLLFLKSQVQENSFVLGAQHKTRKVQSFIIIQGKSKIVITENLVKNYTAKSREKPPDPDLKISNRPKQGKNNPKCFFE